MGALVHRSKVHIVPENPSVKQAFVEPFPYPIRTGMHGGVKAWYKSQVEEELPTTLDHVVAAIASWMTGTLAGALEARQIAAYDGTLETDVDGDIEEGENKVLLLTRVHIRYRMKIPKGKRAQAERALSLHHSRCPVSQSVERGIQVVWSADITEVWRRPGTPVGAFNPYGALSDGPSVIVPPRFACNCFENEMTPNHCSTPQVLRLARDNAGKPVQ